MGFRIHRLSHSVAWAWFSVMYGILVPRPEIKPMSLALHDGFLTTGPLGDSQREHSENVTLGKYVHI